MKKKMFWVGAGILIVGVVLFVYGYTTIQNMYGSFEHLRLHSSEVRQRWDLAHLLQSVGLGMIVLGAIMLLYGILVK